MIKELIEIAKDITSELVDFTRFALWGDKDE